MWLLTALQENPTKENHLKGHRDITEILIFTVMTACAVSHSFHSKNRHQTSSKTTFSCHSTKHYTILCPFSSIRFGLQHYTWKNPNTHSQAEQQCDPGFWDPWLCTERKQELTRELQQEKSNVQTYISNAKTNGRYAIGCWTISPLYHWFVRPMHNLETLPAMHNHINSIKLSSHLTKDPWLVTRG